MTALIVPIDSAEAYDLISLEPSAKLSVIERETLQRAMANSAKLWIGKDDDQVLAMWGLIAPTLMSDVAYLWLHTTEHLSTHKLMFLRRSRRVVQGMLDLYPTIVGHCACDAKRSQQWLRWLGAEFDVPINNQFIPFTIRAKQWQQDSVQSA